MECEFMIEELMKTPDFRIACCDLCTDLIRCKLRNFNNDTFNSEFNKAISAFKTKYQLSINENEVFEIAKRIYKENLANDKYGINNLSETK